MNIKWSLPIGTTVDSTLRKWRGEIVSKFLTSNLDFQFKEWKPTFNQPAGSTLTLGVVDNRFCRYCVIGNLCFISMDWRCTLGGAPYPYIFMQLPFTARLKNLNGLGDVFQSVAIGALVTGIGEESGRGCIREGTNDLQMFRYQSNLNWPIGALGGLRANFFYEID